MQALIYEVLCTSRPMNCCSRSPFSSSEYDEIWRDAEEKNSVLLNRIQPSKYSEECRKDVINYVKSLLETEIRCKVFSFGSVPLKTYLPNGDIDLTAIGSPPQRDQKHHAWAEAVCEVLEREERIHVKEVKCIHAEVPVVKCLVENIIVDITFNQLGGLSTLCFLEEVDKLIGQDHLFKKSIILVKAWCFYESRILGAHYGLLSTYALEVLVLYIFQAYHRSLRGPFEVLYRFLRFFSKFDWEQFCLSPWGPVPLGLLQDFVEVMPPSCDGNFLLSDKFLRSCREKYRTHSENSQGKTFSRKYMNLVDPLRPFNNLGRSVNSGSLVRMFRAFTYGAARLEKLLQSPSELTYESIALFFRNTQSHCEGQRPDAGLFSFGVSSLRNGNHELTSNATETSGKLNHMGGSNFWNANGAHGDKAASDDLSCASLHVDFAKQSNSDASSVETAVKNDKASSQEGLPDHRQEVLRTDLYLNDEYLVNIQVSNDCSDLLSSEHMPGPKSSCMVSEESKVDADSQKYLSSSTSTPKVNSTSSETASVSSAEELPFYEQEFSFEGESRGHRQFEYRDTDADILEGNLDMYLANLHSGWAYQSKVTYGDPPIISGGFSWGGPGRPSLLHSSRGRNVPIHSGVPCLPNGAILGSLPKSHKGTGTFFPNLNTNLERDRRVYSNGLRSSRRTMDSFNSTNQSVASAFKSRSNVPKRRDGQNKVRSKKIGDLKAVENHELATELAVIDNEHSPSVDIGDEFTVSCDRHKDRGRDAITQDLPLRSLEVYTVPASCRSGKGMSIESLEFGSFGPGFLATGVHSLSEPKEHSEYASQTQCLPPRDGLLESRDMSSKAGSHNDQQQSFYYLKEEDFPPLA
ncbi:hypothetical protein GOP47_0015334 [Adiantum capillus-veneris]|uniref:Polymerase nucleotidyl transferase domain-containing protein n=1 Tax=Adiantum capillus-veneris TaxID=13818 RepID=A0A9D4UKG3_ADICA|nr:hypothetical protein GOP47_0015334 [Adiantum capillus-veneris]